MTSVPGKVAIRLRATPPIILEPARIKRGAGRLSKYEVMSLMYFSRHTSLPDWNAATAAVIRSRSNVEKIARDTRARGNQVPEGDCCNEEVYREVGEHYSN